MFIFQKENTLYNGADKNGTVVFFVPTSTLRVVNLLSCYRIYSDVQCVTSDYGFLS